MTKDENDLIDRELLEAWRAGDRAAGQQLFERHGDSISRFFNRRLSDENSATDLVHRTFMGCVESKKGYRGEASIRTYLYSIAKNQLFKHYRAKKKFAREVSLDQYTSAEFGPDPDCFMKEAEDRRLVLKAMRRIPLYMQIAIELRYWEGLMGREIGEVLGVPAPTVRTRLARAKSCLAAKIVELADSPELLKTVTITHGSYLEELRQRAGLVSQASRIVADGESDNTAS